MAAEQTRWWTRRRAATAAKAGAVTAALAVVAGLAVVWQGFDAQQTPVDDGTVWALQSGEGRRYARVNTELLELDTVKQVENPSGLAQTADRLFVYSESNAQFADVSMATPTDIDADAEDVLQPTPAGTLTVASAGDHVAYLTDAGGVFTASLSSGGSPLTIDPFAEVEVEEGEQRPQYRADAVTIDSDGVLYSYSATSGSVLRADSGTGRILGEDDVSSAPSGAVQLTAVGGDWALYEPESGRVWLRSAADPVQTPAGADAVVQSPAAVGDEVYLADSAGLYAVGIDGSGPTEVFGQGSAILGTPAAPAVVGGELFAAWLAEGGAGGTLWSETGGATELDYAGQELGEELDVRFQTNGSRAILNETRSGWVWSVPEGRLVPSSQAWNIDEQTQEQQEEQEEQADRVIDPKPPVAVDDAFGVRAGRQVLLPVLLNDHDPNEDVLSVVPGSVEGLDPSFGSVSVTNASQELVVSVAPGASGSATFRYQITDGTSADGLVSGQATVTLTVVPDDVNSAPVWCGVDGCLAEWPSPEVAPGGTVTAEVLGGWVDPEGDPMYVASAVNQTTVGTVAFAPNGSVVYQHPDPNSVDASSVPIAIGVSDALGATAEKVMTVSVAAAPRLVAGSFAVVAAAGEPVTVDPSSHVSGANGPVALSAAQPLDEQRSQAVLNANASTFSVTAAQPGSYLINYTVKDSVAEATGSVRVTFVDPAEARLSTSPVTAFVRPREDATVDLFEAVSNPAGQVLLLSDVRPEADPLASMSVDIVGQSLLRVSGSTDSGQPGRLGVVRYTVSDGSGNANATVEGEVTVILLGSPPAEAPIAVDDRVTVRAGAQVDIPVLDNDVAPAGSLMSINPASVVNTDDAGLAFASGRSLRYLAPEAPGTYSLSYAVYTLGYPDLSDSATVTVTVLGEDVNSAPIPRTLMGRVLSGNSVSIPFDRFAVDPDGDAVFLDQVMSQPESGSAAISADGDAIVYTSTPGFKGQVAFEYRVRDARGETGTAQVRVGVLDAQSDPSPVTYSDYVQVQVGPESEAVVFPADNDIDPAGGELELLDVVPDAQADSEEYRQLERQIVSVEEGRVTLRAGTALGTYSFVYTVANEAGDTAMGLIVLKVVRESVPDYPQVTDTVLTAENRDTFEDGVDVVAGKVTWMSGNVDDLTLSLWGEPDGVSVDGWRLSGALPEQTLLVPFAVTGTNFAGEEITSYGFLRVPGENDVRLTLKASARVQQVKEKETVDVDMATAVSLPAGATLELDASRVASGGARPAATCAVTGGTVVRYTAGAGAPWADTCTVPVRLAGQTVYTFLTLQIQVEAEDPQPQLRPASITVSPGSTSTYELTQMTSWAGAPNWGALSYALSYAGDQFTVTQAGTVVTVVAKDASRPGREEPVVVSLPSHPEAAASVLTLKVGPAPTTLPKGATLTQQCSQASGSSCVINVVGGAGEVNPLPGTPLRLVSVTSPTNCVGVTFSVAGPSAIQASWSADAPGAKCTGSFVVEDAQGRQSSADRNGVVTLDLQGFPKAPDNVRQTRHGDGSVTLSVAPGAATSAYPALQGFKIYRGGAEVGTCNAAGACEPITGLENGQKASYEARAFNSVGDSRTGVTVQAWAYRAPVVDSVRATAIYKAGATSESEGVVRVVIESSDSEIESYAVTGRAEPVTRTGATTTLEIRQPANQTVQIEVTPTSRFEAPDGSGSVGDVKRAGVKVVGLPTSGSISVVGSSANSISVTAVPANGNGSSDTEIVYAAYKDNGSFSCTADSSGAMQANVSNGETSTSTTISGLESNERYTVTACVGNGFGVAQAGTATGVPFDIPLAPDNSGYTISNGSSSGTYELDLPDFASRPFYEVRVSDPGIWGSAPNITVQYCHRFFSDRCSDPALVPPADPARSFRVSAANAGISQCRVGEPISALATIVGPGSAGFTTSTIQYRIGGTWTTPAVGLETTVPEGATAVRAEVVVTWTGPVAGLEPYVKSVQADCVDPNPDPEPEEPEDPEDPPGEEDPGTGG